jgi:hypothetical protein
MTNPITPPKELVEQWSIEAEEEHQPTVVYSMVSLLATKAAQWGANQELEACIDVLGGQWEWDMLSQCTGWKEFRDQSEELLRAARRPKPPSLNEVALQMLGTIERDAHYIPEITDTIRRALESLPND